MNIYGKRVVNQIIGQKCDTCGIDNLSGYRNRVPIHLEFGYGHDLDGAKYHFCNYKCMLQFILEELKKDKSKDLESDKNGEEDV